MKVLFFGHSNALGGGERCYYESVVALKEQGVEVACVLPRNQGPLIELLTKTGAIIYTARSPWWMAHWKTSFLSLLKNIYTIIIAVLEILPLIKEFKPDIVVTNTMVIPAGAIAAKIARIKHAWYIHEFGVEDHGFKMFYGVANTFKIIGFLSDIILVNSELVKKFITTKIADVPVRILYSAIEVDQAQLLEQGTSNYQQQHSDTSLRILMPSRVSRNKRQIDAIQAVNLLRNKEKQVELVVLGDTQSDYSVFIKDYLKQNNLQAAVSILPFVAQPLPYFSRANLVLMCSTNEAFGRVTVEAMKMGKCVIGARAGATIEIIQDGITGFLFEPENPESLAQKISFIMDNKDIISKVSAQGQKWAHENFSTSIHGIKFTTYLAEAIQSTLTTNIR